MATQIGGIKVQVNSQRPTVTSINYGSKTIKNSSDLVMSGAQNGDVIIYDSANNNFYVAPVTSTVTDLDAGTF